MGEPTNENPGREDRSEGGGLEQVTANSSVSDRPEPGARAAAGAGSDARWKTAPEAQTLRQNKDWSALGPRIRGAAGPDRKAVTKAN